MKKKESEVARSSLPCCGVPAGVVGAHGDEHVEDERGQVRLVHHRLPRGQQAPLQLGDGLQGAPAVHALRPAPRLGRQHARVPELLHLHRGRQRTLRKVEKKGPDRKSTRLNSSHL